MSQTIIDYFQKGTPCSDQYIVIPEQKEKVVKGIYLAEENKGERKQQKGKIIAKGIGRWDNGQREPMQYNVGDIVMFKRFAGDDFYMDEELKIYPQHEELREGLTPIKILRQESILTSIPQ